MYRVSYTKVMFALLNNHRLKNTYLYKKAHASVKSQWLGTDMFKMPHTNHESDKKKQL